MNTNISCSYLDFDQWQRQDFQMGGGGGGRKRTSVNTMLEAWPNKYKCLAGGANAPASPGAATGFN